MCQARKQQTLGRAKVDLPERRDKLHRPLVILFREVKNRPKSSIIGGLGRVKNCRLGGLANQSVIPRSAEE